MEDTRTSLAVTPVYLCVRKLFVGGDLKSRLAVSFVLREPQLLVAGVSRENTYSGIHMYAW